MVKKNVSSIAISNLTVYRSVSTKELPETSFSPTEILVFHKSSQRLINSTVWNLKCKSTKIHEQNQYRIRCKTMRHEMEMPLMFKTPLDVVLHCFFVHTEESFKVFNFCLEFNIPWSNFSDVFFFYYAEILLSVGQLRMKHEYSWFMKN